MGKAISAGISAVAVGSAYDADGDHSIRQNEYVNASGLASSAFGSMARAHADYATALGSRSEEHTSELQSLMRIWYAVFCLKKKIVTMQQFAPHTGYKYINHQTPRSRRKMH